MFYLGSLNEITDIFILSKYKDKNSEMTADFVDYKIIKYRTHVKLTQ
jgi:hypothetical protein